MPVTMSRPPRVTLIQRTDFMLIPILVGLVVVVVLLVVIVAMQPSAFRITRSMTMSASASAVFEQVNNFHNWEAWSPWAKLDSKMETIYDGPSSGVGSIYCWYGNNKVGEGRMKLIERLPNDLIRIKLEFFRPFKATNIAEFTFKSEGAQTVVEWSMTGTNDFKGKAFGLLMNMDKMCGGDFEKGLASLKSLVETAKA